MTDWPNVEDALREALQAMVDHEVACITLYNLGDPEKQPNIIRARAALAAEPASGEAKPARSWPVPFEYVAVENSGSGFPPPPPPPPPPQAEEETAQSIIMEFIARRGYPPRDRAVGHFAPMLTAALRQRADEAMRAENEACARIADYGDDRFIAAAIRSRITP